MLDGSPLLWYPQVKQVVQHLLVSMPSQNKTHISNVDTCFQNDHAPGPCLLKYQSCEDRDHCYPITAAWNHKTSRISQQILLTYRVEIKYRSFSSILYKVLLQFYGLESVISTAELERKWKETSKEWLLITVY